MPSLNFVLPHWMYWGTLLIFPLIAMYLVARQRRTGPPREPILFNAYVFWLTAGFMGLHRMYLRSWWGFVYVPLFVAVLYCNGQVRELREGVSKTYADVEAAQTAIKGFEPIDPAAPTPEEKKALADAQADLKAKEALLVTAHAAQDRWFNFARWIAIAVGVMLVIDAFLMPSLVRKRRAQGGLAPVVATVELPPDIHEIGTGEDPTMRLHTRFTDVIEWVNVKAGEYVAYWAVISVFVYYYEVLARFVFNSPTNWVHESMFLMFGMQYMMSGAYAYREDQHVRVDVFYAKFSVRGKAIADIVTSLFFFIFMLTMLWTSIRFAGDAVRNGETSFTEWGIQYWPVKLTMPIGAALMVLQGLSKLIKDILIVTRKEA